MSKPYDATFKALIELRPGDWPTFWGQSFESVEIRDADLSTVTAATDKVLCIHSTAGDYLQHYDFQAGPDTGLPCRVHGYSGLMENRHGLPVESVVVLLRSKANLTAIDGVYKRYLPGKEPDPEHPEKPDEPYLIFKYRVLRVWELPVDRLLEAGISLLPLAPISNVPRKELPAVIERMKQRLDQVEPTLAAELWTATRVLMGLNFTQPLVNQLLQGVMSMEESVTYQAIVAEGERKGILKGRVEGRTEGARRILLRLGQDQFGTEPNARELATLEAITVPEQLEDLALRVSACESWRELLGLPATPARRPRGKKAP